MEPRKPNYDTTSTPSRWNDKPSFQLRLFSPISTSLSDDVSIYRSSEVPTVVSSTQTIPVGKEWFSYLDSGYGSSQLFTPSSSSNETCANCVGENQTATFKDTAMRKVGHETMDFVAPAATNENPECVDYMDVSEMVQTQVPNNASSPMELSNECEEPRNRYLLRSHSLKPSEKEASKNSNVLRTFSLPVTPLTSPKLSSLKASRSVDLGRLRRSPVSPKTRSDKRLVSPRTPRSAKKLHQEVVTNIMKTVASNVSNRVDPADVPAGFPWPSGKGPLTFEEYIEAFKLPPLGIGRWRGERRLDVLSFLTDYDGSGYLVKRLLEYLPPSSRRMMRRVSHRWSLILDSHISQEEDPVVRGDEENSSRLLEDSQASSSTRDIASTNQIPDHEPRRLRSSNNEIRVPLDTLATGQANSVTWDERKTGLPLRGGEKQIFGGITEEFWRAGQDLVNKESLRHCRVCRYPAVVTPEIEIGRCIRPSCGATFCTLCLSVPHHPRGESCPSVITNERIRRAAAENMSPPPPKGVSKAKWSKRYLRRL